jgi:hypothetical protein
MHAPVGAGVQGTRVEIVAKSRCCPTVAVIAVIADRAGIAVIAGSIVDSCVFAVEARGAGVADAIAVLTFLHPTSRAKAANASAITVAAIANAALVAAAAAAGAGYAVWRKFLDAKAVQAGADETHGDDAWTIAINVTFGGVSSRQVCRRIFDLFHVKEINRLRVLDCQFAVCRRIFDLVQVKERERLHILRCQCAVCGLSICNVRITSTGVGSASQAE